jgi:Leucine-rich repeat (LRR) protein/GTPase SAR1 family protein
MALGKRVGITLGDASQGSSSNVKKTKQDSTSASASGGTGGAVAASAGGGAGRRGRVGERGGGSEGDGGAIVDHGPASTGERRPKKRRQGEDEAEDVELRLRVRGGEDEAEEIVRVRPDMMDLTAHTRLVGLPEELRACAGRIRSLAVRSEELEALPAWVGELTELMELRVDGMGWNCSLQELPDAVGQLTKLRTLELRGCPRVKALPQGLSSLTGLEDLLLMDCSGLKEVPEWVTALTGLRVLFEEWRLRVRSEEGKEEEVFARVRPDIVDLTAHTGLVALPEELRACAGRVRALAVRSEHLEALPAWLGELTGLTDLRVFAWDVIIEKKVHYCPLRELPKETGQLTRLQTLDLSACSGLEALPAELGALTGLRELNLSECSGLTALPAELGALTGLRELVLSGCSALTELPAELGALTGLQELVLSRCSGLTALRAGLGALTGLRKLLLSFCSGLTELPAKLGALTGLQRLGLDSCFRLTKLPAELGAITGLQRLSVRWCFGLTALPAELGTLTGLRELYLAFCSGLKELPAGLTTLTGLQELVLRGCYGLTELPAGLTTLTGLRELDLRGCYGLTELPAGLTALTGLRELDLDGLKEVPAWVTALTGLRVPFEEWRLRVRSEEGKEEEVFARVRLDIVDLTAHTGLVALPEELRSCAGRVRALAVRSEHLEALPAWLGELTGLTDLRVSGWWDDQKDEYCYCPLRELPKEMGQLTRLQTLDLGLCSGLTALPAGLTGALTGLRELHLTGCSALTALPAELGALTGLQELVLRACSALHTPPPRVVAAGTDAVLDFLRDLGDGSAPCHLVKLVLIGEQRAGKSSLADSLVRGNPATRPVDDRTVGIDVHRWWLGAGQGNVKEEYEDWEEDGEDREEEEEEEALLRDIAEEEELVAHIYDAAGHSVYHASHGAFMSAEALFLHVVRSDKSEEEAAAAVLEWVEAVQQEAPGAAMGVVWTHADLLVGDEERERLQRAVLARVKTEIERQVRAGTRPCGRQRANLRRTRRGARSRHSVMRSLSLSTTGLWHGKITRGFLLLEKLLRSSFMKRVQTEPNGCSVRYPQLRSRAATFRGSRFVL